MKEIRKIEYDSDAYKEVLELRNKVMRIPLGTSVYDEDLSGEKDALILGCYEDGVLVGTTVMSYHGDACKIDTLCIDTDVQRGGIGTLLLQELEKRAKEAGYVWMTMDARVSAQKFYEKYGYSAVGETYELPFSHIPHVHMEKKLDN